MDETTKDGLSKLDGQIEEYKEYKRSYSRSFIFSSENGGNFGMTMIDYNFDTIFSGLEISDSALHAVHLFFDTASFDEIERDQKIKLENQISLIGGTMGLFTGFSIISGIELIYFAAKFFLRSTAIAVPKGKEKKDPL